MVDWKKRKIPVVDNFKEIFKCKYRAIMVEQHQKHIQECRIPDTVRI
jgi:hypothetical protein